MTSTRTASASTRTQRRRAEIVDAASALFAAQGYHRVGVDDVAAAVGISGGAIYKHFGGKQDLLAKCVSGALTHSEAALDGADNLADVILGLAAASASHRRTGVLLTREVRTLEGEAGEEIRRRIDDVRRRVAAHIASARVVEPIDARLLADAVLALMCSTAHHKVTMPYEETVARLASMARRITHAELPPAAPKPGSNERSGRGRVPTFVDRRDMLIDAAIDLFGSRGYWSATMDDLGAAVAIAGPSIYQHFDSKADLLVAVLTRGAEGLRLGLSRALAEGSDARDALRLLIASYVDFVVAHQGVNRLLMNEVLYLPEIEQSSIRGIQHRYVAEWVNLVRASHPSLDEPTARFMTHGVLSVVNNRGRLEPGDGTRPHDVLVPICQDLLLNLDPA